MGEAVRQEGFREWSVSVVVSCSGHRAVDGPHHHQSHSGYPLQEKGKSKLRLSRWSSEGFEMDLGLLARWDRAGYSTRNLVTARRLSPLHMRQCSRRVKMCTQPLLEANHMPTIR